MERVAVRTMTWSYVRIAMIVYIINNDSTNRVIVSYTVDWLALHLKVGSGIDKLFIEIIKSYVDKFNIFFLLC